MKTRSLVVAAASVALLAAFVAAAEVNLEGIKCIVSGKPAKAGTEVEHREGVVYFCCEGCPNAYKADKAKFAAAANHQLVATGQYVEAKCPFTGGKLNPETAIEVGGVKVCFCCGNCQAKAKKAEGAEQVALIFGDKAFEKGFVKKPAE